MKKVITYACVILVIILSLIGIISWKKTSLIVNKKEAYSELESATIENMAIIIFEKTRYDFGTLKKGDSTAVACFEFKNAGNIPLIINKIDVSCGCMVADYPKKPIEQNEKSAITVKVDTREQSGVFNKTLFVKSNATEDVILLRVVGQIK